MVESQLLKARLSLVSDPTFRLAVAGHRWNKMDPNCASDISAALAQAMAALEIGSRDGVLMTGMAEGADLLAAAVRPSGWRLDPVLATSPEAWRTRLGQPPARVPEDVQMFDLLMASAAPATLPPGLAGPDYQFVAAHLSATCHRLLAVWDGKPGHPGGTGHVVALVRARGRPVDVLWHPDWALSEANAVSSV